jgi:hypothetical protein
MKSLFIISMLIPHYRAISVVSKNSERVGCVYWKDYFFRLYLKMIYL